MPRISEFHGIVITMNYQDHNPPHFHATAGEHAALIGIDPIEVVAGRLPARARSLVLGCATLHQAELAENGRRAQQRQTPTRIAPLP